MLKLDPVPIKLLLDELHRESPRSYHIESHPEHTVRVELACRPTDMSAMWEIPPEISSEHTRRRQTR
jgi:hypothetical protein